MSVKSERRAWFAANVEPRPALKADAPEYLAWVARANAHMRKVCKPMTAELLPGIDPKADYTIAAAGEDSSPVVIAEITHVDIAPVTPIKSKKAPARKPRAKVAPVKVAPKRGRVKTTPLTVPARVAVNALVSVADVQAVDMRGGDVRDIARDARYLVLAAHPERGSWWLQRFDGATGTSADLIGVQGKSLKVAGNSVAAASYVSQPLEIAA